MKPEAWLPNVAGGVSIWRLAPDLNRPDLFDRRLLEPRTEGPPTLPTTVEWNLSDLVPLADADRRVAADALADFVACVERCAARIDADGSGFERYRGTLTLPALDSGHYFLDPRARTLRVRNWGARPRSLRQRTSVVIDYRGFARHAQEHGAGSPARDGGARTSAHGAGSTDRRPRRRAWWALLALLALAAATIAMITTIPASRPRRRSRPVEPPPRAIPIVDAARPVADPPPPLPAPHQTILFELGNPLPNADQRASLEAIADYLVRYPVRRVLIEGHADHLGAEPDNLALSVERARQVREWLITRGVAPERLAIAGCSERYPLGAEGANRRVEFFVIDPPIAPAPHAGCVAP